MSSWLFIFGRTHELSLSELVTLVHNPIISISPDVAQVEDPKEEIVPEELINKLGGTVKIALVKGKIPTITPEEILQFLHTNGKQLTFGLSIYGDVKHIDFELLRGVKEALAARGIQGRYVAPHEGNVLSSVVIKKQHVRELILVTTEKGFIVGETVAVQDFEAWNMRDYRRPFADPKAGMLPPKVARIVVNLAMRDIPAFEPGSTLKPTLLDPFCGMGTILGEALLAGWAVLGSDQSEVVVEKAKKNLEWLVGMANWKLFVSDATHVSEHIPSASVDAIVTEPFLGSTDIQFKIQNLKFKIKEVKNIIKGLEKLYIGCLRDWYRVLKPGGNVVIALPEYAVSDRTLFVKSVIDRCEIFGYTVSAGPLEYSRPQAVVRRKFFILTKK